MDKSRKAFRYFFRFGLQYKSRIILYFIANILYSGIKYLPIYLLKVFYDDYSKNLQANLPNIYMLSGYLVVSGLALAIFSYFSRYLGHYIGIRIEISIKDRIYNHFTGLPLSYFQKQEKGDLITKMTHDTGSTGRVMKRIYVQLIPKLIEGITLMLYCVFISWQLSILFLVFLPLIGMLVRNFGKKISRRSKKVKEILSTSTVTMEQFFSGIKLVKSFHSQMREEEKFKNVNKAYLKAHLSTCRVKARSMAFIEMFGTWFIACLVALGAYVVAYNKYGIEPGAFIGFMAAFWSAFNPIRMVGHHWVGAMREFPSLARLFEVLHTQSDITIAIGAVNIDSINPGIEFVNVHFSYENNEVIKGLSLHIKPGEMVAFVGPSGGGKTTLLDLIPRFYEVQSGAVRIGGQDIRDIHPDSLMRKIAIVLQDSFIFNSSAFENIRYGLPDAPLEDVVFAAQQANIHDTLEELENGYNTFLGEDGSMLSGGQKQRMSIARALLKKAPILIMDEPTSELDAESEKLIIDSIEKIRKDRILLIIAHRLSTVQHSDKIVVINDGVIEASGTHQKLLDTSLTYKRMCEIQFSDT